MGVSAVEVEEREYREAVALEVLALLNDLGAGVVLGLALSLAVFIRVMQVVGA